MLRLNPALIEIPLVMKSLAVITGKSLKRIMHAVIKALRLESYGAYHA